MFNQLKMQGLTQGFMILYLIFASSVKIALAESQKTYTVGVVPQFEAHKLFTIWRPLLDDLEKHTKLKFQLVGSPNIEEFEEKLLNGEFDFAYINPYQATIKTTTYRPLLRDHNRKLQGILVVRKDSPITDVKQLNGKNIAFPSPNSLGASLLIRAELQNNYAIKINPRYVTTHDSVYLNVIYKNVQAGGGVQKTLQQQNSKISNQLRVLYRTQKVAPHAFAANRSVNKKIIEKVKQALLNMAKTKTGSALLAKIPIAKIGTASTDDYLSLKKMKLDSFRVSH